MNGLIRPDLLSLTAFAIAEIRAEVLLTLGLALMAISPLAWLVEQPRKRLDDTTLLIRDSLSRRAKRRG